MNRTIKFRIWDKDRNKMYYLLKDRWSFGTCEDDKAVSWEDVFAEQHDCLIPMQYTGLKDKNDKEIYEGDIGLYDEMHLFSVEWDDDSAAFLFIDPMDNNILMDCENSKKSEIIGNKNEDPELLNDFNGYKRIDKIKKK